MSRCVGHIILLQLRKGKSYKRAKPLPSQIFSRPHRRKITIFWFLEAEMLLSVWRACLSPVYKLQFASPLSVKIPVRDQSENPITCTQRTKRVKQSGVEFTQYKKLYAFSKANSEGLRTEYFFYTCLRK